MNPALISVCLLVVVRLARGDDVQLLSAASSDFSQRLYQKIASGKPEAAIFSPYSIHSALSMTSLGARGETATELSKTLGLTALTGNSAHQAYHDLILQLNTAQDVKLHTANAIFVNPNTPIEEQFVHDVKSEYLATSSNFDLAAVGGPEKEINDFVNATTEGLIKDVLPPGAIDAMTVMVLVNTIFFNGTWENKFPEAKTHKADFQKLGGAKSQMDMMYDERYVNIKRNVQGVDVAELPFKGGRFSLYIALPQTTDGITALENSLASPGYVDQLFEGLSPVRVRLSVPKFKIESKFELNSALQQLGIVKAFEPASANFQGISPAGNLYISDVIHKALIEVKETGTVAAAVTAVGIKALVIMPPPTEAFTADRPFVHYLRDKQTGAILFQGNLYISDVIHKAVIEVKETGTVAAAVTVIGIHTTAIQLPPVDMFKADHPFVFFLRDNQSQDLLFQGKFSGNLYISDVIHKAVIEVKETGTVAAAVTVIGIHTAAIQLPPVDMFQADHPFVFFLRDNQSQDLLFQGKFSG